MFGILRTTLALMVMFYHLFFGILPLGTYAVFGFYIISGYLMTLIMQDSYGYTWLGRYSFAINRFLRLYPQYWMAVLFSIALVFILGSETVTNFHKSMFLPTSFPHYLTNLFMMFPSWHPNKVSPRLVPPTWALTVEIFFYVLICIGISKTFTRVKIWFFLSIGYVLATFIFDMPWKERYFPVAAASLPFSIGSSIYFMSKNRNIYAYFLKLRLSAKPIFILMLANCFVWMALYKMEIGPLIEVGFYLNILIFWLLVYSIVNGKEIVKIKKSTDKFIGDFSYPIYLLHWQTGLLVSFLLFDEAFHELSVRGLASLSVSLLFVAIVSILFMLIIDKPIQTIRAKIKAKTR